MIYLKEKFADKKELIRFLVKKKMEIIQIKKGAVKYTTPFGILDTERDVNKGLSTSYKDDVASGIIKRTIIANTYNWMDSHDDVHLDNVFEKSIKDRGDKVWHLHDHLRQITAKVGKPLSIYEKTVLWKDLGVDMAGKTMALFMDSNIIKEYNAIIFQQYLDAEINQHSVGMMYVSLELAVDDEEMKEEFACWSTYIDRIGNKDKVKEQGFFWAIKEAKLDEISCVLAGSNELTPTVDNKLKELVEQEDVNKKNAEKNASDNFWRNIAGALKDSPLKI